MKRPCILMLLLVVMHATSVYAMGKQGGGTIVAFGDSLTVGIGGSGVSFPRVLQGLLDRQVVLSAVPGELTIEGARRLPGVLERVSTELLILCLGTNDFRRRIPAEQVRSNLLEMINLAQSLNVPVLLIAVPGLDTRAGRPHPIFDDLEESDTLIIDRQSLVRLNNNPLMKADLVHLNAEGYRQLAEGVAEVLQRSGWLNRREDLSR